MESWLAATLDAPYHTQSGDQGFSQKEIETRGPCVGSHTKWHNQSANWAFFKVSFLPLHPSCCCSGSCLELRQRLVPFQVVQPPASHQGFTVRLPLQPAGRSYSPCSRKHAFSIPVVGGRELLKRPSVCCPRSSWFLKALASQGLTESLGENTHLAVMYFFHR